MQKLANRLKELSLHYQIQTERQQQQPLQIKIGIANFNSIRIGHYRLKELSTNVNYVLNEVVFEVEVEYQKTTVKDITNEHKRGNLKVYKVDKDNHKIALGNVKFDLYSCEFKRVIGTYTTNVDRRNFYFKFENWRLQTN